MLRSQPIWIRWVYAGLILTVGTVLLLLFFIFYGYQNLKENEFLIKQSNEILKRTETVLIKSIDNATGARGYVLTGEEIFLEPFLTSQKTVNIELVQLREVLNVHRPSHLAIVDTLTIQVRNRIIFSQRQIELRKQKGMLPAAELTATGEGKLYLDKIRLLTDQLKVQELQLLEGYNQKKNSLLTQINSFLWLMSAFFVILILLMGVLTSQRMHADRNKSEGLSVSNLQLEHQVAEKSRQQTIILERITDAFVSLDQHWCYTYMNKKAGEIFQRDPQKMIGRNIWEEFPEGVGQPFQKAYERSLKEQRYVYLEEYYAPYDKYFENHIYPSQEGISIFFREITEQKKAQQKLIKTNRLYNFISQINQTIVHCKDEQSLLENVCKIAVGAGDFRMAWIGLINADTGKIEYVKQVAGEGGNLNRSTNSIDKMAGLDSGLYGKSVREKEALICNDIETDPQCLPWRKEALLQGYYSFASIPVCREGVVAGFFSLFSAEKNFFDSAEITLLEEAAADISFSLDNFLKENRRMESEKLLNQNRLFLESLINTLPDIVYIYDLNERRNIYVNEGMQRNLGFTDIEVKEMGDRIIPLLMHPDDFVQYLQWTVPAYYRLNDKEIISHEFRMRDKQEKWRWLLSKESVYSRNANKSPAQIFGITSDITEQKERESRLKEQENQLRLFVENSPAAIAMFDRDMCYLVVSRRYYSDYHLSDQDITGRSHYEVFPEIPESWKEIHRQCLEGAVIKSNDESFTRADGSTDWLKWELHPWRKVSGEIGGLILFSEVITERKKAEMQVLLERNLSNSLINGLPGIFYLYTQAGKFLRWNKNFEAISGYTGEEMSGMNPLDFFNENEKSLLKDKIDEVFNRGEDSVEAGFLCKNGQSIPYFFNGRSIEYEGKLCLMGVGIDISERVKAQEEIRLATEQLGLLSAHLQQIREEERKRIGREIHDELGQQLTAIKMDVAWLEKKTPEENTQIKAKLRNIISLLDSSHLSIRKILSELRIGVFDHQGLEEALSWQSKQFSESTGIPISFHSSKPVTGLNELKASCLFRVLQESLTNISRYAGAGQVSVELDVLNGLIRLTVTDDGSGIAKTDLNKKGTFGILGMRERVKALDGNFLLETAPGKGTRIQVSLPYTK